MAVISMKQLLEAGVHFGHQTRRWNPKMAQYIFTERHGIYLDVLLELFALRLQLDDFLLGQQVELAGLLEAARRAVRC